MNIGSGPIGDDGIELATVKPLHEVPGIAFHQAKGNAREFRCDPLRQSAAKQAADARNKADGDTAGDRGLQFTNLLQGLIQLAYQAGNPDQQFLAGFRDLHPATMPVEQGEPDVLLEQPDLTRQRGLRHAKPVGGFAQRPRFRKNGEGA